MYIPPICLIHCYLYIFCIEPSFGIGRIMYSIFEHNFKIREGMYGNRISYCL